MHNQSHRFIGTACFSVAAFILAIIASVHPVITENFYSNVVNDTTNLIKIGLFTTCNVSIQQGIDSNVCQNTDLNFGCDALTTRFQSSRAFSVISCLILGISALIAFIRMVHHFPLTSRIHTAYFVLSIVGASVTLIAFPVIISVFTTGFCGFPAFVTLAQFSLGSCGEWMSIAFGFVLAAVAYEIRTKPNANELSQLIAAEQRFVVAGTGGGAVAAGIGGDYMNERENSRGSSNNNYGAVV